MIPTVSRVLSDTKRNPPSRSWGSRNVVNAGGPALAAPGDTSLFLCPSSQLFVLMLRQCFSAADDHKRSDVPDHDAYDELAVFAQENTRHDSQSFRTLAKQSRSQGRAAIRDYSTILIFQ